MKIPEILLLAGFHQKNRQNKAIFVKTDVSDPESVKNLIAVTCFGIWRS